MSKHEVSIMEMPENVKLEFTNFIDESSPWSSLSGFKGMAASISFNWILLASSAAGFALIPNTTGYYGIPMILIALSLIISPIQGVMWVMLEIRSKVRAKLNTVSDMKRPQNEPITEKDGLKIYSWKPSSFLILAHLWLPLRIFKKVKIFESITYFPHQDKYLKQSHYLTFSQWIKKNEVFEGHRAVFKNALDAF